MKYKDVKVKDLKLDPAIYEIRKISRNTVYKYATKMRGQNEDPKQTDKFPFIVITANNEIIDGAHIWSAYKEVYGGDYETRCILSPLTKEEDKIQLSILRNDIHGRPLESYVRTGFALKLAELGCGKEKIAQMFKIPVEALDSIDGHFVYIPCAGAENEETLEKRPAKSPAPFGTVVYPEVYEKHIKKDRAFRSTKALVNQLIRFLENDWVDPNNKSEIKALSKLKAVLDLYLSIVLAAKKSLRTLR